MTRTLLILLVCALAASSLTAPAAAAVPAGNLVADPGAEQGGAATDAADVVAPPAPWVPEGPFTQVAYGAPDFPSTAVADSIGGGTAFFAGGPDATTTSAEQNLDVEAAAEEIDAGTVTATLSADLGGSGSQEDSATVDVRFLDLESGVLGRLVLDAVTATDRGGQTILLPRSADGAVPVHTRRILVRVTALRDEGAYNDGYADNVSLTLHGPGPEPTPAPTPRRSRLWSRPSRLSPAPRARSRSSRVSTRRRGRTRGSG